MKIPALAASFFNQVNVDDLHAFVEGFAHVVDREGRGRNRHQSFHFHAGLRGRDDRGAKFHAIFTQPRSHINVRQRERMTKRNTLRGAFCSGDSGDARDFQGIALGILEAAHGGDYAGLHFYEGVGFGGARGHLLGGDVDHLHFAAGAVVGEFRHRLSLLRKSTKINTEFTESTEGTEKRDHIMSFRRRIGMVSPALTCPRSAATTRKQFACANAAMSTEPCHGRAFTSGVTPRHSTRAGRKWARPGFSFSATPSLASTNGKSRAAAPLSRSIAGTTNSSNVTIVDTGLPGRPKTKAFPHCPKTAGFPGRMATASR